MLGMVFLEVDGLRVHVELAGSGPSLLLLHGWGSSAQAFSAVVPALARHFRVCALDFPGFGLSQMPPSVWGVDDFAASVVTLLRRLAVERTHLLGHSHGGRVGIALAQRYPALVDKLILVDSAGIRPPRTLRLRLRSLTARTARRLLAHPLAGERGRRSLRALYRRLGMGDYANAGPLRATFVRIVNEDLSERLAGIGTPTLVVWGRRDAETPLWMGERMASSIPGAKLVVLEGAGHFCFLDSPRPFEQSVLDFLADAPS
jgi:pimeloyl-ACP methyl ester carboxylesterase